MSMNNFLNIDHRWIAVDVPRIAIAFFECKVRGEYLMANVVPMLLKSFFDFRACLKLHMDSIDDRKIHISSHRIDLVDQFSCDPL